MTAWPININLWQEKPIKDKCLPFTSLALGKLEMIQLCPLAGSSFTPAQTGKDLRSRARACAAAGDVCTGKRFSCSKFCLWKTLTGLMGYFLHGQSWFCRDRDAAGCG